MPTLLQTRLEKQALRRAKRLYANRHKNHSVRSMLALAWTEGFFEAQAQQRRRAKQAPQK